MLTSPGPTTAAVTFIQSVLTPRGDLWCNAILDATAHHETLVNHCTRLGIPKQILSNSTTQHHCARHPYPCLPHLLFHDVSARAAYSMDVQAHPAEQLPLLLSEIHHAQVPQLAPTSKREQQVCCCSRHESAAAPAMHAKIADPRCCCCWWVCIAWQCAAAAATGGGVAGGGQPSAR